MRSRDAARSEHEYTRMGIRHAGDLNRDNVRPVEGRNPWSLALPPQAACQCAGRRLLIMESGAAFVNDTGTIALIAWATRGLCEGGANIAR
jgi:hypothetical protein